MKKMETELQVTILGELLIKLHNAIVMCGRELETGKKNIAPKVEQLEKYAQELYEQIVVKEDKKVHVVFESNTLKQIKHVCIEIQLLCISFEQNDMREHAIEIGKRLIAFASNLEHYNVVKERRVKKISLNIILEETYYYVGHLCLLNNDLESAKKYLKQEFTRIPKLKKQNMRYEGYYSDMAMIAVQEKNLKQAKKYIALAEYYFKGSDLAGGTGKALAATYSKVGAYYLKRNNFEEAIDWYENAAQLLETRQKGLSNKKLKRAFSGIVNIELEKTNNKKELDLVNNLLKKAKDSLYAAKTHELKFLIQSEQVPLAFDEKNYSLKLSFEKEYGDVFKRLLKKKKWPYEENNNSFVLDLLDLNVRHLSSVILETYALHSKQNISIGTPINFVLENKSEEITYQQEKAEKLARHLAKENELLQLDANAEEKKEVQDPLPSKEEIIKWDPVLYPPHDKNDSTSPYKKMHKKNGTTTYWFINDSLQDVVPNSIMMEKFVKVAKDGKVFNSGNSENRQGFVFFEDDKDMNKFGKEYDCKIKVLGKWAKFRFLGKKVAEGKKFINDEQSDKKYELYEFDKLGSH